MGPGGWKERAIAAHAAKADAQPAVPEHVREAVEARLAHGWPAPAAASRWFALVDWLLGAEPPDDHSAELPS